MGRKVMRLGSIRRIRGLRIYTRRRTTLLILLIRSSGRRKMDSTLKSNRIKESNYIMNDTFN